MTKSGAVHVPQVIVALSPAGELVVELPGPTATRHRVVLKQGEAEASLRTILHHQMLGESEIGLDGAPTQAQVQHWESHSIFGDPRCRFCLAEGRVFGQAKARKKVEVVMKRSDGVEVQRIAPKVSGLPKKAKAQVILTVAKACPRGL